MKDKGYSYSRAGVLRCVLDGVGVCAVACCLVGSAAARPAVRGKRAAVFLEGRCAAERKGCELPAGGFPEGSWQPWSIYLDDKVLPGPGGGCAPGDGIALTTLFDVCKVLVFGILRFGGAAVYSRASKP